MAQQAQATGQAMAPAALALAGPGLDADAACRAALEALGSGVPPVEAAARGCSVVPHLGPAEAACASGEGKFGAVAVVEGVPYPALAALAVHATPHNLLAGRGALSLCKALGLAGPSDAERSAAHAGPDPFYLGVAVRGPSGFAACVVAEAPRGRAGLVGPAPLVGCALAASHRGVALAAGDERLLMGQQVARSLHLELSRGVAPAAVAVPPNVAALLLSAAGDVVRGRGALRGARHAAPPG